MSNQQLATKDEAELPANLASLGLTAEDMGAGFEEASSDAYAIPFLRILQSNSPACDSMSADRIEGAEQGMFMNTVTEELFDGLKTGIAFIPCHFQQRFLQWGPRKQGGGLKGVYTPAQFADMEMRGDVVRVDNKLVFKGPNGELDSETCDTVSDTRSHFGLVVREDQTLMECILTLSGTQVKKSRQIMAMLANRRAQINNKMVQLPSFSAILRLTTVAESNDSGNWAGIKAVVEKNVEDNAILAAARDFHKTCKAETAKVNYGNSANAVTGDEVPF